MQVVMRHNINQARKMLKSVRKTFVDYMQGDEKTTEHVHKKYAFVNLENFCHY